MSRTETNAAIIFHAGLIILVVGSADPLALRLYHADHWDGFPAAGIGRTAGWRLAASRLTEGLRHGRSIAILAPFDYTAMIWAVAVRIHCFGPTCPMPGP